MTDAVPGMWRFVAPAPIEAAHVLTALGRDVRNWPDPFTRWLIYALHAAPEPTLLQLASLFPGYASAVVCAKDGDYDRLKAAAGEFVKG
jgi:hypothetical protein